MYLCFVICAVSGITILACQITLCVLGFGDRSPFPDEESTRDSASDVFSGESDGTSLATPTEADGSSDAYVESSRLTLIRVRAIGLAITFFGLMGCAADASQFTIYPALAAAFLVGFTAYLVGVLLIKPTALLPFDESMTPFDVGNGDEVSAADDDSFDDPKRSAVESDARSRFAG